MAQLCEKRAGQGHTKLGLTSHQETRQTSQFTRNHNLLESASTRLEWLLAQQQMIVVDEAWKISQLHFAMKPPTFVVQAV